jgi:hypothetical protein
MLFRLATANGQTTAMSANMPTRRESYTSWLWQQEQSPLVGDGCFLACGRLTDIGAHET